MDIQTRIAQAIEKQHQARIRAHDRDYRPISINADTIGEYLAPIFDKLESRIRSVGSCPPTIDNLAQTVILFNEISAAIMTDIIRAESELQGKYL